VTLKPKSAFRLLGKRITGVDNEKIVRGEPLFGIDQRVPGMVYATFAKAPAIGARAVSANLAEVRALPGVKDAFVLAQPRLELKGLMTIPPADEPVGLRRARFARLAELHRELCAEGLALDTLSMGMSADYELAIAAGSTCVRIGTGVFGPRADHRG
jgi:hypothetical protein